MKNNKRIFLIAFITIIMIFSLINFANINVSYASNKLSKPENLKWSETKPGVLTFSKVQNADAYWAVISKDGQEIGMGDDEKNEVSIQELIKEYGIGTYTVQLSANRLDGSLQSSEKVTTTYTAKQLSKPENLKWSETKPGVLTFSKVQYADRYWTVIFKDGKEIGMGDSTNEVSIQELIKEYGIGTYTVQLSATSEVLPSSEKVTTTYTAKQLSKPENLKWSETEPGVLTFSKVQYADRYWAAIFKDGKEIAMGDSTNEVSIQKLIKEHGIGTYTVQLSATSEVLPSSEKVTTTYTAKQLSKPENLKWSETKPGVLTFSKVQYADRYWTVIFKDGKEIGMGDSTNEVSIQELIKEYGTGTYTVQLFATSEVLPSSEKVTTTYTVKDNDTNNTENNKDQTTKPSTTKPSTPNSSDKENIKNETVSNDKINNETVENEIVMPDNNIIDTNNQTNISNETIGDTTTEKGNENTIKEGYILYIVSGILGIVLAFIVYKVFIYNKEEK